MVLHGRLVEQQTSKHITLRHNHNGQPAAARNNDSWVRVFEVSHVLATSAAAVALNQHAKQTTNAETHM
jgi:hypothetical protein